MPTIQEIREQYPMYSDLPDGELARGLHSKFYSDMPYAEFLRKIDFSKPVNPTEGMSAYQLGAAGAGKAANDIIQGGKQLINDIRGGPDMRSQVNERRALEAPLMNTTAGKVGNVLGNLGIAAGTMLIPGVNSYTGAGLTGAAFGAINPVGEGESRLMNTTLGGGFGLAGQAAGNLVGRLLKPVQSTLTPEEARLAQEAASSGIPLTAGQATGSKPLKITESVLENLPLTSERQLAVKQAQKEAFNRAVLSRAGIQGESYATPQVLAGQKQALGQTFQNIAGRNAIDFNKGTILNDLAGVQAEASRRLSHPQALTNTIDDILTDAANGTMSGTKYQGWRETLGRLSRGSGSEAHYFGQAKKALDRAFSSQVSGADAAAWSEASRQYGNLKTILGSMGGAGGEAVRGNISPAQLGNAVAGQVGREGRALGRGDLNDLQRIGRAFVSESLPDSGSAQRLAFQNALMGNVAGTTIGGTVGALTNPDDPLSGAKYGAGIGAVAGPVAALAGPRLAQALMQSGAGKKYLTEGLVPPVTKHLTEAQRAAITNALRSAALSVPMSRQ